MNAKTTRLLNTLAAAILFSSISRALPQSDEPWTDKQLKDPAALAATLADAKAPQPVIFNIGPVQQIKGAIAIGPVKAQANLDKLKQQLAKLPKDKEVIIYCGCCPLQPLPECPARLRAAPEAEVQERKAAEPPVQLER